MPACTVLLFYRNHFIDEYCHLFIPTRVTLEFMAYTSRILRVLKILYTHACLDRRAAWGAKANL